MHCRLDVAHNEPAAEHVKFRLVSRGCRFSHIAQEACKDAPIVLFCLSSAWDGVLVDMQHITMQSQPELYSRCWLLQTCASLQHADEGSGAVIWRVAPRSAVTRRHLDTIRVCGNRQGKSECQLVYRAPRFAVWRRATNCAPDLSSTKSCNVACAAALPACTGVAACFIACCTAPMRALACSARPASSLAR